MSTGSLPCVGEEDGDLSLEAMKDEEVTLVDGVFEGAFGALRDEWWCVGNGYSQKDKNEAKTDKTEHGIENRGKVKVNPKSQQVKAEDEIEEILNGPMRTQDPSENSSQGPPHVDHHYCYGCGDSFDGIFCQRCTCESCGNGAHYGYNCPPKVPIISNPEPCHNQNVDEFSQTLTSFHPTCYSGDENSFTYDSTPNFVDDSSNDFNPPSQPSMDSYEFFRNIARYSYDCSPQVLFIYNPEPINDSMIELCETFQAWLQQQVGNLDSYSPDPSRYQKIPIYYDDDDDEESSTPLRDIIISELSPCIAITPVLSTEEPKDSLIIGDKHLDTIPDKESDEFIKSSVKNLVPNPSEFEDLSNIGSECDVPVCDDFTTFSNLLFDADDNFSSSDDKSFSDEDYPDVNPPSPEISNKEIFQAKGDLMKSIQTFLERFNCIPFEEKPQILFQTWETFFAIQCSQPKDSNELFQKILEDLKKLAEYDQSTSTDRPIFLNSNEGHSVQDKESLENPFNEIAVSKPDHESELELEATTDTELSSTKDIHPLAVQGPPQDSDIHQLIEECSIRVPEEQKQKMEDTIALDSKILLINSNSQHLDKQEQEVKNDTSQISLIHSIAPIQSTKEPEHSLSMGYEHLSITPETESDEVTESNAENLLPIPSKWEVALEDEIECDMPAKDVCSPAFTTFSNPLFKDYDNFDSSDDESLPDEDVPAEEFKIYSNPLCDEDKINSAKLDPHCFNVESDFVESLLNRDTFIDFSSKFDFFGELAHFKPEILKSDFDFEEEIRLIENLLYDNSFLRPPEELNAEIADTIIESIPLPIPVQDGNSQQEEIDIVTETDDVLPMSIENFTDDPEGDIRFLEELLIDDSILSDELLDANFEKNPLIPRPPPKPPDIETDA
nr:hypothetical protein [Tanacetum cinerariifolium]